jgi:exonuclease SbcC
LEQRLQQAQQNHRTIRQKLDQLQGSIEAMAAQLADSPVIDEAEHLLCRDQLTQVLAQLRSNQTGAAVRMDSNRTALDQIRLRSRELEQLEARSIWLKSLSNTVNGTVSGKEKLMLETFVQTTFFDRIIARANTRFMVMSGGQYELIRNTEPGQKNRQTGLDLNVIDHYNATVRSVRTLSGGEAFKASLSLALGLSEQIQAQAGGVKLDAMFVDEGFGSLDEESLRHAMKALSDLSGGNRLVGIISHVPELKERIDRQILVTKDRSGGSRAMLRLD